MARRTKRAEEAKDDRQAEEARDDKQGRHDKHKGKKHSGHQGTTTVNEKLKGLSHQTGHQQIGGYPADPANAEAVYSTGPGQAVEYNYKRLGTYGEEYAQQQHEYQAPVPPISGFGQVLTTQSAGGTVASGAANNPT